MTEEIKSRLISRFILIAIILGTIGILFAISPVSWAPARKTAQRNYCINSMRQIHSAIHSASLARRIREGERIPNELFTQYLKDGKLPECPGGGTYKIPPVGGIAECSEHGKLELPTTK